MELPIKEENSFNLDALTYPELPVSPEKPHPPLSPVKNPIGDNHPNNHKVPIIPLQPDVPKNKSTMGVLPLNHHNQFNKFYSSSQAAVPNSIPRFNGNIPSNLNHPVPNLPPNIPVIPNQKIPEYPTSDRPPLGSVDPQQLNPAQSTHHPPTTAPASQPIPSTRSQVPTVTPSGTHLDVASHGQGVGQVRHPSQQPLQPGHQYPAMPNGQLPLAGRQSVPPGLHQTGLGFPPHNANGRPQTGNSLPGNGLPNTSQSPTNNQSGSTMVPPPTSSQPPHMINNNNSHAVYTKPGTVDPRIQPVSMAPSSTTPPAVPNTTTANLQQPKPQAPGLPPTQLSNPPSSHPASVVSPRQPNLPQTASPKPDSSTAPSSMNNAKPVPPSLSNQHIPDSIPKKPIPQVPSPSQAQPTIPKVPQTFTSSRTGMTHGLPPGWERVLEHRMGRYYFRDHNTKTTHWNLPASLAQAMNQNIMGQPGAAPTAKDAEAKKLSLKRSLSSPNLAKLDSAESKDILPRGRPMVNRRTKPLSASQLSSLDPVQGGQGKALTGLKNLGNSCYMNSVLQCLMATAPLIKYILNSYYVEDINKTNPLGTGGRIAEELAVLTRVAHSGNYRHVSPVDFKRTIGRFASHFGGQQQQDSQEFLLFLLDQFHEDTNRVSWLKCH